MLRILDNIEQYALPVMRGSRSCPLPTQPASEGTPWAEPRVTTTGRAKGIFIIGLVNCTIQANALPADQASYHNSLERPPLFAFEAPLTNAGSS